MKAGAVFACYLLLASTYLFYLPHAQFVLDDWFLFQNFERARAAGPAVEWKLAGVLVSSRLWGTFRTHWLSLLSVYGLYHLAGLRPAFYFLIGVLLHVAVAFLLYRVLRKLEPEPPLAFLAGALFLLLPTARNPLFWFPSCGQYILAAFWFLLYLHSVAGTMAAGKLERRVAAVQALTLVLALFSTDQSAGLLLLAAPWLAVCWRSRAALASAALAWITVGAAGGLYAWLISKESVSGALVHRFDFSAARVEQQLRSMASEYYRLLGFGGGYYRLASLRWGLLVAAAAGLVVWWRLRSEADAPRRPPARAVALGAGLWAIGYGPVWFLEWSELRYHYLPSIGVTIALAALCVALLRAWPRRLLPAGAALLAALCAATAFAEIGQCWTPQAKNLASIQQQLRRLKDLRYHDVIVIAGVPLQIGTAPHFAMIHPYCSTPFVETVTGQWGLVVGREIYCDSGRWSLQNSYLHELQPEDLRRTHVLATDGDLNCRLRTLVACEVSPGAYRLFPLKDYEGSPPLAPCTYSHDELRALEPHLYRARRHGR